MTTKTAFLSNHRLYMDLAICPSSVILLTKSSGPHMTLVHISASFNLEVFLGLSFFQGIDDVLVIFIFRLRWVLVAACGILNCSMWDLVP